MWSRNILEGMAKLAISTATAKEIRDMLVDAIQIRPQRSLDTIKRGLSREDILVSANVWNIVEAMEQSIPCSTKKPPRISKPKRLQQRQQQQEEDQVAKKLAREESTGEVDPASSAESTMTEAAIPRDGQAPARSTVSGGPNSFANTTSATGGPPAARESGEDENGGAEKV